MKPLLLFINLPIPSLLKRGLASLCKREARRDLINIMTLYR
jgi:hypothetical protein